MKNDVRTVKLYFMVGLPTECDADIDEMIELVRELVQSLVILVVRQSEEPPFFHRTVCFIL